MRIQNLGSSPESLSSFHIQSDPSQDYDLSVHVASIAPGQILEFQSGTGSADNPGAGIYKLTGSNIYRNDDPADYARLLRPDAGTHQVNCGSTPVIPSPTPSPGPLPSPTGTPPSDSIKGDADCNGSVQAPDAIQDLLSVAGINPGLCVETLGNVDCTDGVTIFDSLDIQLYIAGLPVPLPPGCSSIGNPVSSSSIMEIHHIDVEQGDATLIITPGSKVLIDDGRWTNCSNTVSYLQSHAVTSLDYHFATHYDADHIGCLDDIIAAGIPINYACYDRGGSKDTDVFNDYVAACGGKRQTATKGQVTSLGGSVTISWLSTSTAPGSARRRKMRSASYSGLLRAHFVR